MHYALTLFVTACLASSANPQTPDTQKLDKSFTGAAPLGSSDFATISTDGEYVAFLSNASDIIPAPVFGLFANELYVRDVRAESTIQVNLGSSGQSLTAYMFLNSSIHQRCSISSDGRFVAFPSRVDDPGLGDTNGNVDIFLRDLQQGTTELISTGPTGATLFSRTTLSSMSDDARYVAFIGHGNEFVPGLPQPLAGDQVYLRDRQTGLTKIVSHLLGDQVLNVVISADGSTIAYVTDSLGTNNDNLWVYDVATGTDANLGRFEINEGLSIDGTGSKVAFATEMREVIPGDTNKKSDVFVIDVVTGVIAPVNISTSGHRGDGAAFNPSISPDGRYVAFDATGEGLAPVRQPAPSATQLHHVYIHDLETGLTTLGSINDLGIAGQGELNQASAHIGSTRSLSEHGSQLVFDSNFLNLAKPTTTNQGVFLRELHKDGPALSMTGLVAGSNATLHITGASPSGAILVGVSLAGQGPLPSYWGLLDLSPPITTGYFTADANGTVAQALHVPASLVGTGVFAQGIDLIGYEATTTYFGVVQ